MTNRTSILALGLLAGFVATPAFADGFSLSDLFPSQQTTGTAKIRQPGHNRYAPFAGVNDVAAGHVYSSGYYTSRARAEAIHNRYVD